MPTKALPELDAQYRQLREGAGYLLRDDRVLLKVTGGEAAEYLQGQLTNEIEELSPGDGCYAALLDRKGHMQADATVLRIATDELWLELEEVAVAAAHKHLDMYKVGRDAEVATADDLAVVSVVGPQSTVVAGVDGLSRENSHREVDLGGVHCRAVATYCGVDLICESSRAGAVTAALAEAGAGAVSEAAAELIRLESGRPRFGVEMGPETIPAEAGIVERAVNFEKGCYIGQETVARLHYKGKPNRHLRGLRLSEPAAPGEELRLGDREVGRIGTAGLSPAFGPVALAIVRREASPGDELTVGDAGAAATVVDLPFG